MLRYKLLIGRCLDISLNNQTFIHLLIIEQELKKTTFNFVVFVVVCIVLSLYYSFTVGSNGLF